jgi:hypothetical protein
MKYRIQIAMVVITTGILVAGRSFAQRDQTIRMPDSVLYSGNNTQLNDSVKLYVLKDYNGRKFARKSDQRKYDNLLRIVKKVYPLAKLAGQRMEQYAAAVDTLRKGQVEDFILEVEDEVKNKYGADLKKLGFREGIVLLKLLDRQTSMTAYTILKELKDGFSAVIWQGVAGLFDYNLKDGFNPYGVQEDQWIEEICQGIDAGRIK